MSAIARIRRLFALRAELAWLWIREQTLLSPSNGFHGDNSDELDALNLRQHELRADLRSLRSPRSGVSS